MPNTTQSISRRTLAKGAAWAVPVAALSATAPALAASPGQSPCGCYTTSGTQRTYTVRFGFTNNSGTAVQVRLTKLTAGSTTVNINNNYIVAAHTTWVYVATITSSATSESICLGYKIGNADEASTCYSISSLSACTNPPNLSGTCTDVIIASGAARSASTPGPSAEPSPSTPTSTDAAQQAGSAQPSTSSDTASNPTPATTPSASMSPTP